MKDTGPQVDAIKNGWILTARGTKVFPLQAEPDQITLEDIAHALAMQCRWNGHTRWFYSVAQHCVEASIHTAKNKAEALMHDATEAYMSDVPRPVKRQMPEFRDHEEKLMAVIMERFGLKYPLPDSVHEVDNLMLRWEARDLFYPERCTAIFGVEGAQSLFLKPRIEPWDWLTAKRKFLHRAEQLGLS